MNAPIACCCFCYYLDSGVSDIRIKPSLHFRFRRPVVWTGHGKNSEENNLATRLSLVRNGKLYSLARCKNLFQIRYSFQFWSCVSDAFFILFFWTFLMFFFLNIISLLSSSHFLINFEIQPFCWSAPVGVEKYCFNYTVPSSYWGIMLN